MADKKDNSYFSMFVDMASTATSAAGKLRAIMEGFSLPDLQVWIDELHAIESEGDRQKHALHKKLAKDFITPIERDDILQLAEEIDDVTDAVEDVLLNIYMYNIKDIPPEALEFAGIVERCCSELLSVMKEFADFRKSKTIQDSIIELNRLEELGDRLYLRAVHVLYAGRGDPLVTVAWAEVYSSLEKCCDTCEHVADVVAGVIMKNT